MKRIVFIPVAVVLAWWAISVTRSLSTTKAAGIERPSIQVPVTAPRKPASVPPKAGATAKGSPTMPRPFEFQDELSTYVGLQSKVFLTPNEKRERADLLRHAGLLRALGQRLLQPVRNMDLIREQDAAIDLLLEALKNGDKKVASEVLQGVVQDKQVEDTTLERGAREQLAGLKAEVLYQWSSMTPDVTGSLQAWLPGPVSQKIWANVLKMQQSNLAESEAEARAMSH